MTSCQKDESFLTAAEQKKVLSDLELSSHNHDLMLQFLEGKLIAPTSELEARDPSIDRTLLPSKKGTSLVFESDEQAIGFLNALEQLKSAWDYSDAARYDGTPQEINHVGNPALNAVDALLGHNSLRKYYEQLAYEDGNLKAQLGDKYISDPDLLVLLDLSKRLIVGSKTYKFLENRKVAIADPRAYASFSRVDNSSDDGFCDSGTPVIIYDPQTGNTTVVCEEGGGDDGGGGDGEGDTGDEDSGSGPDLNDLFCNFYIETGSGSSSNGSVSVRPQGFNAEPFTACGAVEYTVEWSDGTISGPSTSDIFHHIFDVSNIPAEECGNFRADITGTLLHACGNCGAGKTETDRVFFTICPNVTCVKLNGGKEEEMEFEENNVRFKVIGEIQQRTGDAFFGFLQPQIWTTVTYEKYLRGKFRKRRAPNGMEADVAGAHYNTSCDDPESFNDSDFGTDRSVSARAYPGRDFLTRDDSPTEPIGNVRVFSESNTAYEITGIELH